MVDIQHEPYTFFVAVDGSEASHNAFQVRYISSLFLINKQLCFKEFYSHGDHITICTITDKNKTYLLPEYQPEAIYNQYHTFLLSHVKINYFNHYNFSFQLQNTLSLPKRSKKMLALKMKSSV